MVVGGCHLDDVGADQVQPGQSSQHQHQLTARHAGDLRGARTGSMRWVEHVDVDGQVHRVSTDPFTDLVDDFVDAAGLEVVAVDHPETQFGIAVKVITAVQRPPDTNVNRGVVEEESLLGGPAERGCRG